MIKLNNLYKNYGDNQALKDLSITFKEGSITGIVGSDGAGKTTLLRMLAGIISPSGGKITINGFDVEKQIKEIKPILGYMPQNFGLYQDLTVIENLDLYAALKGVKKEEREEIFQELLTFTGLDPFRTRFAGKLSGGMKQKLALACTMIGNVKVVLLDEPGVGVDIIARGELWNMVNDLAKNGITILWSTSYLDEAEQFKEILLLNKGEVIYQGEPQALNKIVEKQVFLIKAEDYRASLQKVLKLAEVKDAVFQGQDIRVIFEDKKTVEEVKKLTSEEKVEEIPPLFEDAFIYKLGGLKNKISNLNEKEQEEKEKIAIDVKNLTKKFGSFYANTALNFQVESGNIFALIGPNGAGKTTAFKMLCALLDISEGQAKIFGYDIEKNKSKVRSFLGYMSQKFALYSDLSVRQNLSFFCGIYDIHGKAREARIQEILKVFELDEKATTKDLSLGFKQRLALACSILHQPKILFLDEPTSGVDIITRREFWIHINALARSKVTIVITTHFLEEAEYCDQIALIDGGKLIAFGSPKALKEQVQAQDMNEAFIRLVKENR